MLKEKRKRGSGKGKNIHKTCIKKDENIMEVFEEKSFEMELAILKSEVKKASCDIAYNKAPGCDTIPIELTNMLAFLCGIPSHILSDLSTLTLSSNPI